LNNPSIATHAVRLLIILTRKGHVTEYRTRELWSLYDSATIKPKKTRGKKVGEAPIVMEADQLSAILVLQKLYACYKDEDDISIRAETLLNPEFFNQTLHRIFDIENKELEVLFKEAARKKESNQHAMACSSLQEMATGRFILSISQINGPVVKVKASSSDVMYLEQNLFVSDDASDKEVKLHIRDFEKRAHLKFHFPAMLFKEWNDLESNHALKEKRQLLLEAMTTFVKRSGMVPEPDFALNIMLKSYDASQSEVNDLLFKYIIPRVPLCQLLANMPYHEVKECLYRPLERAFVSTASTWSDRCHVVSVAAIGIIRALRQKQDSEGNERIRNNVLSSFVQWMDKLIVAGLYTMENLEESGRVSLCMGALDLYQLVGKISQESYVIGGVPSPPLMYNFLLSPSVVCIDRVCGLLILYLDLVEIVNGKLNDKALENSKKCKEFIVDTAVARRCEALVNSYKRDFVNSLWTCPRLSAMASDIASEDDLNYKTGSSVRPNSILFDCLSDQAIDLLSKVPKDNRIECALSITHGSIWSGFAISFLKMEGYAEDLEILAGDLKTRYLEHLGKKLQFRVLFQFLAENIPV